jgi:CheY-like chemotaxis protein
LFQKVLEHDGHTVLTAANGREALEVMRHQVPDLILLDMLMPAMDGPTFLKLIRRHQDWAHVPVVIMSAVADECNVRNVAALGVRDYLLKAGFSLPMLRKRIAKYLEPLHDENESAEPAAPAMLVE